MTKYVWTVDQSGIKTLRFQAKMDPRGRGLSANYKNWGKTYIQSKILQIHKNLQATKWK